MMGLQDMLEDELRNLVEAQRARIAELEAQVASATEHANKCYLGGIETGMDLERDRVVAWLPELADRSSAEFGPVIEGVRDFIANGAHRRPE